MSRFALCFSFLPCAWERALNWLFPLSCIPQKSYQFYSGDYSYYSNFVQVIFT
eukprot:m.9504 g.9504  ORF g.9504 m.9504 type:complete len:53 (+) comp7208_c0_seq1:49-207(+)